MRQLAGIRIHIRLGNREIVRAPRLEIRSARHRPFARAHLVLPDPHGELYRELAEGDQFYARLSYRNQTPAVWRGKVALVERGRTKDQLAVFAVRAQDAPLASTTTRAWFRESPEAILADVLRGASITPGRIDAPGVRLEHFVAGADEVWQVARKLAHACQQGHGLDMSRWALWADESGAVHWGDFNDDASILTAATGAGLIRHSPGATVSAFSEVETFWTPAYSHSRLLRVVDQRRGQDTTVRALDVRHLVTEEQARTFVRYGRELSHV